MSRVHITPQRAKQVALAAATSSTGLATLSAIMPVGMMQSLFVGSAWAAGAAATTAAALWFAKSRLARATAITKIQLALEEDFASLRAIAVTNFGDKVTSIDRMKKWWERNPTLFSTVTTETRRGKRKIVDLDGYFVALPLTANAASEIAAEAKGVNDLDANDICVPTEVPTAVYIGAVVGEGEAARSAAMQGLVSAVKRMSRSRRDMWIMARPVTDDGLRLVNAFGMQPVRIAEDPMGVLHRAKMSGLVPEGRRRRQRSRKSK